MKAKDDDNQLKNLSRMKKKVAPRLLYQTMLWKDFSIVWLNNLEQNT